MAEVQAREGPPRANVIVTAGVHGDEPATPWALLSLVRDGLLDPSFAYRLWPCTNPSGYAAGTRENAEGMDINRSFGRGGRAAEARAIMTANRDRVFDLNLDLHEDFEATGFYCYEPAVDVKRLGPSVVRAIDEAGFPVQELDEHYDLGYPEGARGFYRVERGCVVPDVKAELSLAPMLPHSIYLLRRSVKRSLTFESPRALAWDDRIVIHRIAVVTALERLRALVERQTAVTGSVSM
ncbi:MAG: succinylglutamate desuccinylase/aspartoacylase family protein [Candidatus Eremiobacteraeota bacterium]|nr:succinylglutamate desuccinylase/aspartoacylase family protein [Candidatus Eremiobacteraeota bacterium]